MRFAAILCIGLMAEGRADVSAEPPPSTLVVAVADGSTTLFELRPGSETLRKVFREQSVWVASDCARDRSHVLVYDRVMWRLRRIDLRTGSCLFDERNSVRAFDARGRFLVRNQTGIECRAFRGGSVKNLWSMAHVIAHTQWHFDGKLLIGGFNGGSCCLDAATGRVLWEIELPPGSCWFGPRPSSDLVLMWLDHADETLSAILVDALTGKERWRSDNLRWSFVSNGRAALVYRENGRFCCVELASGKIRWECDSTLVERNISLDRGVVLATMAQPVLIGEHAWIPTASNTISIRRLADGYVERTFETRGGLDAMMYEGNVVLVATPREIGIYRLSGEFIRSVALPPGTEHVSFIR